MKFIHLPRRILVILALVSPANSLLAQGTCIDTDGDRWGWNGIASCLISEQDPNVLTTQEPINNHSCIDTDGDGWGWNGNASCLIDAQPPAQPANPTIDTESKYVEPIAEAHDYANR